MGQQPEQTVCQFEIGSTKLASYGSMLISLAGGEPLLRPDLPDIVRAVSRWHLPFITTNGWLANDQIAQDLYDAGLWGVSVSIDYADATRHDRARGMKGAFERAVAALESFSRARRRDWQRINLLCVLMHNNVDQIEELIKLAAYYRAYFMVQPYCELKTRSSHFCHDDGEVAPLLLELRRKYPNFLSNPYFLGNFDRYFQGGVPGCRAGRAFFNIDSTGDIAICVEERLRPVANLYRDHRRQIHTALQDAGKANRCQSCWYNCRGEVESLYSAGSLMKSLHLFFRDRSRPQNGNGHRVKSESNYSLRRSGDCALVNQSKSSAEGDSFFSPVQGGEPGP